MECYVIDFQISLCDDRFKRPILQNDEHGNMIPKPLYKRVSYFSKCVWKCVRALVWYMRLMFTNTKTKKVFKK